MGRGSKVAGALVVALALIGGGLWLARGRLALAATEMAWDRGMASDPLAALPDGLHVGLCGSGSPLPDPTRAGPCTAVVAGRSLFVIDAGEGSVKTLALMRLPPSEVSAAFITHYHSDHIADLGELMLQHWMGGASKAPLPVYGPSGLGQVLAGFESAYRLDRGYRIAHHGPVVAPPAGFGAEPHEFAVTRDGPPVTLIDEPELKVIAFPVDHEPAEPAVGYAFVYKGHKVVVSGDTAPSPRLSDAALDADVLVHEGLAPGLLAQMRAAAARHGRTNVAAILGQIGSYHSTPAQAATLAARDKVRFLLFTHIIPPLPIDALDRLWLGEAPKIFRGPIRIGHDGDFLSLPTGSHDIRRTNRLKILWQG